MVACINILYWENRSGSAADGSAVSCFLRVSDHLESICKIFFFTEKGPPMQEKFRVGGGSLLTLLVLGCSYSVCRLYM